MQYDFAVLGSRRIVAGRKDSTLVVFRGWQALVAPISLESGQYSHDHLLAAEQRVANELARAQSHGGVVVGHVCGVG
jgi:hypothetical protein